MSYLPLEFDASDIFPRKTVAVRPDVHVMVSSGTLPNRTERDAGTTASIFELSYSRKSILRGEVDRVPVELRPGYASLGFLDEASGHAEYDDGEQVELYSIWVSPRTFDDFCEAVCGEGGRGFRSFQKGTYRWCGFRADAREESVVERLGACLGGETDGLNRLLLESHVLELLSVNIERLLCQDRPARDRVGLSKSDMEQLAAAREILLNRLESPPSLLELSHLIHMNDCKLKRSFKRYYGKTVYEFVREQRLERAFSLLEQKDHNVSEAACAVGYTNVSHFSEAFRKRFGIAPHVLRRENRP